MISFNYSLITSFHFKKASFICGEAFTAQLDKLEKDILIGKKRTHVFYAKQFTEAKARVERMEKVSKRLYNISALNFFSYSISHYGTLFWRSKLIVQIISFFVFSVVHNGKVFHVLKKRGTVTLTSKQNLNEILLLYNWIILLLVCFYKVFFSKKESTK